MTAIVMTIIVRTIVAGVASLSHEARVQFVGPGWKVVVVDADRLEGLLTEEPEHDEAASHFSTLAS